MLFFLLIKMNERLTTHVSRLTAHIYLFILFSFVICVFSCFVCFANQSSTYPQHPQNALRNMPQNKMIRFDLAKLYTKLKMFDLAERVLTKALSNLDDDEEGGANADFKTLVADVETLLLLVETQRGGGDLKEMKRTLNRGEGAEAREKKISPSCLLLTQP